MSGYTRADKRAKAKKNGIDNADRDGGTAGLE